MEEEKILERMIDVYKESKKYLSDEMLVQESAASLDEEKVLEETVTNLGTMPSLDAFTSEVDGNYFLYFNDVYTNVISKWLKQILKYLTWHILKRQVHFNSAVKSILNELIHRDQESLLRSSETVNNVFSLEQKVQHLSNQRVLDLEQKVQHLSIQAENYDTVNQQLVDTRETVSGLKQRIEELDREISAANNLTSKFASSEESKIESGLWFNDPTIVGYRSNGEAYWAGTTERILEKLFILQSISRLYNSNQITILDVGAAESLLSYELASLKYSVTAIDIRPIALSHPNLKFVRSDICKPVLPPSSFDCVIALSTLEHIGLGWYGDETGEHLDREAVKQIETLLKPGGNFILTVPYGKRALTPVHRIYDKESLQRLVQDFDITQVTYGLRLDDFTWTIAGNEAEASLKEHNPSNYLPGAVAMLVCKRNT